MSYEDKKAMYENALENYKPMIINLKSQLANENITAERKKDVIQQIENAENEVTKILANLEQLKKESDK